MQIPIIAIAEDRVDGAIIKRLLQCFGCKYKLLDLRIKRGYSDLDGRIAGYNNAARDAMARDEQKAFFVLRDFDSLEDKNNCPQGKITTLLRGEDKADNFLFRLAVAEGENWLLADYDCLCEFLCVSSRRNIQPDKIRHGKEEIFAIAKRSRNRGYKKAILPSEGVKLGAGYNKMMEEFILYHWQPQRAARNSKSLRNTLRRLEAFIP